jgi:PDZ domain-containing protein
VLPVGLLPGNELVREDAIVPQGMSSAAYDRTLVAAMDDSQTTAAVVAERAAGLRVPMPQRRFVVSAIVGGSRALGTLRVGDEIVSVEGTRIGALGQLRRLIEEVPAGSPVALDAVRAGTPLALRVPTTRVAGHPRLGVEIQLRPQRLTLPVPVRFSLANVSGSSAGLMFALAIYRALRGDRHHTGTSIAGTGTLALDGTVGPIEGTLQKLIAAKRAGAQIFLVPAQNFREVASERDLRIVPVTSFRDALAALRS